MDEIDAYLEPYSAAVHNITNTLRELLRETVPGVLEKLYPGWQILGYRSPTADGAVYFAYIAPYDDHVRLGFEWGVLLAGAGNMQGDGNQVRYLTFYDSDNIQPGSLAPTIREALKAASLNKDQKAMLALQRQAEQERDQE